MVLAEVGLSDLIWTTIRVFFLVTFISVFITVVSDLFGDRTLSGVAKAAWVLPLVLFPSWDHSRRPVGVDPSDGRSAGALSR